MGSLSCFFLNLSLPVIFTFLHVLPVLSTTLIIVVLAGVWVTCLEWASFCIILLSFIFPLLPPIPLCACVCVCVCACDLALVFVCVCVCVRADLCVSSPFVCPSPSLVNLSLQDKAAPPPLLLLPPLLTLALPKMHLLLPLLHRHLFLLSPLLSLASSPRPHPSLLLSSDLLSPHSHTSSLHPVCHTLCSAPLWEPLGVLSCQPTHQLSAPSLPLRLRLKMTSL